MKFICVCILAFACAACMIGCGGSAPEDNQVCNWGPTQSGKSICATAEEAVITGAKGE